MRKSLGILGIISFGLSSCNGGGGSSSSSGGASESFGLTERQAPDLPFAEQPVDPEALTFENAFPNLRFDRPLLFRAVPGLNRNIAVEQRGTVRIFDHSPSVESFETYLDITERVIDNGEEGLLGLAFAPDYEENGFVFVQYSSNRSRACQNNERCSIISRFTRNSTGNLEANSERVYLEIPQPFGNHNGGMIEFGEGYDLYIAVGDGGSGNDPDNHSQNRTNLLGTILRIDVSGDQYTIPNDNPFVGVGIEGDGVPGAGAPVRGEIWAYGLRNPYRFSIDRTDNALWIADVGQDAFEEVDVVFDYPNNAGVNFGWRVREGAHRRDENNTIDSQNQRELTDPIHEYDHSQGRSISGGIVYRGQEHPQMYGAYVYGDFEVGSVWSLTQQNGERTSNTLIANEGVGVAAFGEDHQQELYLVHYMDGHIKKMVNNSGVEPTEPPTRLSETGIFTNLASLEPSQGLIPYEVNVPFWSDRAFKQRWAGFPNNRQIQYQEDSPWSLPVGSVLVKHFDIHLDQVQQSNLKRLETRVMVNGSSGWRGYTYRWNDDDTDATLVNERTTTTFDVITVQGSETQTYVFPGPEDCLSCHNRSVNGALGINTFQLNRDFDYPRLTDNQIRSWNHIDLLSPSVNNVNDLPRYASISDDNTSLEEQARSYLAVNCSSCHNPNSGNRTNLDFRITTANDSMNAIGDDANLGSFGLPDAKIIDPGNRDNSVLWLRMNTLDGDLRMPPEHSQVVDELGVDLIGRWIDSLN